MPGAAIPVHRHLHSDEVLFVHKGQGRATLGEQSVTVLPGMIVYVPRESWHSLRNTGTGLLEVTWMAAPAGIEDFFREMSRLGGGLDAAAMQALGQRYGIEFRPDGAPEPSGVKPAGRRHHRRHRGGRGPRQGPSQPQQTTAGPQPAALPTLVQPSSPGAALEPQQPSRGRGGRRHRGRHGSRPSGPPAPVITPPTAVNPPLPSRSQPPSKSRASRGGRPHRRGHMKEVYMGGRWIQVTGEGPVIDPGRERSGRGRQKSGGDEDTPAGPLSVPL